MRNRNEEFDRLKHVLVSHYLGDVKNLNLYKDKYREGQVNSSKHALYCVYIVEVDDSKRKKMNFEQWKKEAIKRYFRTQRKVEKILNQMRGDE